MEIFFVYEKGNGKWLLSYKITLYNIPVPIDLNFNTTQKIFGTELTDTTGLHYQQDQNTHFVYE